MIKTRAPIGRRVISEQLQLKDGVTRGLLERLSEQKVLIVSTSGVRLSKIGEELLDKVFHNLSLTKIAYFEDLQLARGKHAVAAHVSHADTHGLTGVVQRDEAIKVGANGAITLLVEQGKLKLPPENKSLELVAPMDNHKLLDSFKPFKKNDIILVSYADTEGMALTGTIAGIFSLQHSKDPEASTK